MEESSKGKIIESNIEDVMHNAMMPYAEHVILDRALPRVEDGLKPVQRRVLYSMFELGVTKDKPFKKSARIVGDCMGKYHPHGDSSVYGTMVRLAQPFMQSEPLIEGHGNFGSIDGDSPAAMRYTEVRLEGIAMEMLRDLEKDTVKWSLNFDDTLKEPDTLPCRYPNLLVNGSSGIAVGLATNIPPHNITECIDGVIAFIEKSSIKLDELMSYIKAPDFPTGAYVIAGEELTKAYETGKGKVIMRAKTSIEKQADKKTIIITELPYLVNKATMLSKINDMRLDPKKEIFKNIQDIIDASDRNGMKIMIKIKREGDANAILKALFKSSELECAFNINMIAIANGKPQQMGLLDIIRYYVEYQRNVVFKRSQYDLAMAKAREHILRGILIAVLNIDQIIKIIRGSANTADCKIALRQAFDLSEKQAQAILDIKLGRLTKLEIEKVKEEIDELIKQIEYFTSIISSKAKQLAVVKKELLEIRKQYKRPRRSTLVLNGVQMDDLVEECDLDIVQERSGFAVLTAGNTIKFMSKKAFSMANKALDNSTLSDVVLDYMEIDNKSPLYLFTNDGNCVKVDANSLSDDKWRHKGTQLTKLCKLADGENVIAMFTQDMLKSGRVIIYTSRGMIKCSEGNEYIIDKPSFVAITLKNDGEKVIGVELKDDAKQIFMATQEGYCCNMESDIPTHGRRASGVIGIQINDNDSVVFAKQVNDEGEIVVITDNVYAKRVIMAYLKISKRNRKGVKLQDLNARSGFKLAMVNYVRMPYDIALIGQSGDIISINTEDISIENTISKGRAIKNIEGKIVVAIPHNIDYKYD